MVMAIRSQTWASPFAEFVAACSLTNFSSSCNGLSLRRQNLHNLLHRSLRAATEVHKVTSSRHVPDTFSIDSPCKDGSGSGTTQFRLFRPSNFRANKADISSCLLTKHRSFQTCLLT